MSLINRKHLAIVEDLNGLTVFALTGSLDFIIDSVKSSVKTFCEDKNAESLKALVLGGNLVLTRHYLECVHDNTPMNNFAFAVDEKLVFNLEDLLKYDFGSQEFCVAFETTFQDLQKVNDKLLDMFNKSSKKNEVVDYV